MNSLDIEFLREQSIPIEMGGLIQALGEFRGRQDMFRHQTPQALESLRELAIIESTESSNRIEGVTVSPERFRELMRHPTKPKDRSEAEILGYRRVLSRIHMASERFQIDVETIQQFHKEIYAQSELYKFIWNALDENMRSARKSTRKPRPRA